MKIGYDLLLYAAFRGIKPPEELRAEEESHGGSRQGLPG